jgi:hypothetical protein
MMSFASFVVNLIMNFVCTHAAFNIQQSLSGTMQSIYCSWDKQNNLSIDDHQTKLLAVTDYKALHKKRLHCLIPAKNIQVNNELTLSKP